MKRKVSVLETLAGVALTILTTAGMVLLHQKLGKHPVDIPRKTKK